VADEIPAQGSDCCDAKDRMENQTPLYDRMEWAEGDGEAGNKFKEKDGGDSAGKWRRPSGWCSRRRSIDRLHLGLN
jgi:hypothetical protein